MRRTRIAVLGTGNIARFHAAAIRSQRDEAELVAAADVDGERLRTFCDEYGVPGRYSSLDELLEASRPDLVHLCTPPGTHAEQAIRCLSEGISVLCEKPPCLSLAELDRVVEAERRSGAWFVTVFQHRFASSGRHVKALIDKGALGRPLLAVCNTLWYRDQSYFDVPWRGRWDTEGGGPTLGHGIHQMDLLAYLLGEWEEVTAVAARLDREMQTEDVSLATVRFASGALATVTNSVLSPREESYLRIDLTGATVELSHLYGYGGGNWRLTPAPGTLPERAALWRFPEPDAPSGHAAQIADVIRRLRRGEPPEPSSASARVTMALVTAVYASAFTGRPVRREELTPANPFYHALHGGQPDRFRQARHGPSGEPALAARPAAEESRA